MDMQSFTIPNIQTEGFACATFVKQHDKKILKIYFETSTIFVIYFGAV